MMGLFCRTSAALTTLLECLIHVTQRLVQPSRLFNRRLGDCVAELEHANRAVLRASGDHAALRVPTQSIQRAIGASAHLD